MISVSSSLLFFIVISPLSVYCKPTQRRRLPHKPQNIDEIEIKMLGLVAEDLHTQNAADAAPQHCSQKQRAFRDAPGAPDGSFFVDSH